ncbi:MAG TPA: protein-disulfide reductase DsbD domain-containing protein [Dongiaceae bacterium]|nr:protein-disulfide reductase DsbD domain-containing protein [Dongiaceae bacterium]
MTCRALTIAALLSAAAYAHAGTPDSGSSHFVNSADHVHIAAIAHVGSDGRKFVVTVVIDPEFHINANPASLDYLIPTMLNVTNETPLRVIYPHPVSFTPKFAGHSIDVYQGRIEIIVELPASGVTRLYGTLTAQACTDRICLPPADLLLPAK